MGRPVARADRHRPAQLPEQVDVDWDLHEQAAPAALEADTLRGSARVSL